MTTLTFQNTNLSAINQNNQIWLTLTEIGRGLGYSDPFQSVKKIYDRYADEFTPCMTTLIEIQTAGGMQKVRVFSLRGTHLIAMFARTKIAKAFRKWVLDILDEEVKKSTALLPSTITPEQQQAIQSAVQQAHHRTGLHWQEIYRQLKAMFHIAKYDQLPQDQFGNAMAFVMNLQPIALLPTENKFTFNFTERELQTIAWGFFILLRNADTLKTILPALEALRSGLSPTVYGQAYDYHFTLKEMHRIVSNLTEQFEFDPNTNWRVLEHIRNFDPKAKFYINQ
jgi:hypothetical protein